jgi:hypothetical protein
VTKLLEKAAEAVNAGRLCGRGRGLRLPINGKMLGYTQAQNTYWYADLASDPVKAARQAMRGGRNGEELPLLPGR